MNAGKKHHQYGKSPSEETKNKIKNTLKGKYSLDKSPRSIPIKQYDKQMNFIKEWSCATEAGLKLGIEPMNIRSCCKNLYGRKSAGGFIWKYA